MRDRIEDANETGDRNIPVHAHYRPLNDRHEPGLPAVHTFDCLTSGHLNGHVFLLVRLAISTRDKDAIVPHQPGLGGQITLCVAILVHQRQHIVLVVSKGKRCEDQSGECKDQCGEAAASFELQHGYHSFLCFCIREFSTFLKQQRSGLLPDALKLSRVQVYRKAVGIPGRA
jgi:hypothetical protein